MLVVCVGTYLHIVPLVVVAALAEQAVVDDVMDIKLVEKRISVLWNINSVINQSREVARHTLETDAVKTTTS